MRLRKKGPKGQKEQEVYNGILNKMDVFQVFQFCYTFPTTWRPPASSSITARGKKSASCLESADIFGILFAQKSRNSMRKEGGLETLHSEICV